MYDVAIIGAGVVGAMCARTLAKYDVRVCLIEKENDVATGATRANSAIVHAGFDAKEGSLKAKFNVRGSEMMEQVCRELGVKYKNNGSLVIGFNAEDRQTLEELLARGNANGVKGLYIAEKEELEKLEPNLSDTVECALVAPTGAIVCPYELTIAAVGNAMDNGADLERNFEVSAIEKTENGYRIFAGEKAIEARFVINAAGLYSDKIAKMIGDDSFDVHPRKGEYILMDKACGSMLKNTIFRTPSKMGKGILVSPTVDGNLLAGPTSVDMEDKENTATSAEGFDKIIKEACENVKEMPFRRTITSFCGLRAVGSTGDFIIKAENGFVTLGGIESPGLTSAPAIGVYATELLAEQGLELKEKADYNPIREAMHHFREASMEEKNEIIKKDKSYGKIVCRCEGVTEGEILAAIRQNPKALDLDGVKRRTRAQMGRCQGGFCSPYIVELLAREHGMAYEQVTKSGRDSYINVGKTKEV
ncbi:MAG: NAD(P)/FAD-dependent oxidoreductase [Clostridia bacterium]|nr:NAD(P)/FAD-dependent oxidoreductase [Clostridia bacterium]